MNRTIFLVDGFNLYHSLCDAQRDSGQTTRWLNVEALCSSFVPLVGQQAGERASLERIHYFSALPTHLAHEKQRRHKFYMRCLRGTGVNVELGRFLKKKTVRCRRCGTSGKHHVEKETDVAIATLLFDICVTRAAESIVLVTGDTDLSPAVRTCRRLFADRLILFAFPYRRTNNELEAIAPESFSIKLRSYLRNQFPDPLVLSDGTTLSKPAAW